MNVIKVQDLQLLEKRLPCFPWYVEQYIQHKIVDLSPSTLLEYTRDFETFIKWMIQEGLSSALTMNQVTLSELEQLTLQNVDTYKLHLQLRNQNSVITRERKLASLKSLFHYLSQIAEDDEHYPLLKRNVMAKLKTHRHTSAKLAASRLQGKILEDDAEIQAFCSFVARDYITQISDNPHVYRIIEMPRIAA